MRVVIIDPLLKNLSGHCYFYDIATIIELKKRGIPFLILGNADPDESCLKIENFFPCSTDIISSVFEATASIKKLSAVFRRSRLFKKQLERCLFKNPHFSIKEKDVIFVPTFYIFEFIFLGWFFGIKYRQLAKKDFKLNIMLRFRYIRNSRALTLLLGFSYKLVCNVFLERLKGRVVYLTDSELLKKEYEALLKRKIMLCPIPLNPFIFEISEGKALARKIPPSDRIVISYAGGARYNKGFDTFTDMAIGLYSDKELSEKITFAVQLDIHPQAGGDIKIVREAVRKIEYFCKRSNNIKIIRGALAMREYYRLLSESHIIVLPYRDEAYKSSTANILIESVLLEKVPVVSCNTWMAYELAKSGLQDLIFEAGNVLSLTQAIKKIVLNYAYYHERIKAIQPLWSEFHSAGRLVDMLVGGSVKNQYALP